MQKLPLLFTKVNQVVKIVQYTCSFFARVANTACLLHLCTVITSASFFVGGGGGGGNLFLFRGSVGSWGRFLKKLCCCVAGENTEIIWFCQLR